MEPASVEQKPKGRKGSLENPEVYENVPGHVIPILEREFDDFDTGAAKFLAGETPEDQFIGFRLKQGVYGQRQADVQMIRVKLPFGGVTPEQMDAFADMAEQYAPLRKGHITTRQNFQFHHIPLPDAAKAIRLISESGLSSREACGNTVRNVTGDPWAGVCEDELFDPTPYVGAFVRYFVRNEVCQLLPRKFKVAFTATDEDRAITNIHDLGFVPRIREVDGKQVKGFEIRTGGGTSIMPRVGAPFWEFASVDDGEYLKVSEAVLRIFDRQDDLRANRARARIKFLIDRVGIEEFRAHGRRGAEGRLGRTSATSRPTPLLFIDDEQANAPAKPLEHGSPNGDSREFDALVASNVQPQRQEGFSTVEVKVTRGDLTPEQFRGLAADHARLHRRLRAHERPPEPRAALGPRRERSTTSGAGSSELGLGDSGAHEITDVVSCPGTDRCKLGITSSMGLNAAVQERLEQMQIDRRADAQDPREDERLPERLLTAPHRQHRLLRRRDEGRRPPAARLHRPPRRQLRRRRGRDGQAPEGRASRPSACRTRSSAGCATTRPKRDRRRGVQRLRRARRRPRSSRRLVKDLSMPVEFGPEHISHFIDWERSDLYEVVRGEGECAV